MKNIYYAKTVLLFIAFIMQMNYSHAQRTTEPRKIAGTPDTYASYTNAIGLRAGETSGISFKHFFNSTSNAGEFILGVWPYALRVTGLYENYVSTNTTGLRWYYGAGAHVTFGYGRRAYYPYYGDTRYYAYRTTDAGLGFGLDGIIGAEYKIPRIPFAISLDIKPFIEINNRPEIFMAFDPGFGIKYTF